jgi:hypothetical protein
MKKVIVASAIVVLLAAMIGCKSKGGPSLSETLSWMSQTYNPYEDGFGGHGEYISKCSMNCEDVGDEISWRETLTYKGCQITTKTTNNRKTDHGLQEKFNLGDIDLQSIRVVTSNPKLANVAEIQFSARNNAEALIYTGNIIGKGTNSEIAMDDPAYAERFASAFRHAVELCGGKPSTF